MTAGLLRVGYTACQPDERFTAVITHSIEACLDQNWPRAFQALDSLITANPAEPAPYFYRATVYSYRMTDEESFRWEEPFLRDLAIADSLLTALPVYHDQTQPVEEERRYLLGSIHAWKSLHAGRRGHLLEALAEGVKASRQLEDLFQECPDWADLMLGIGNLRYWKSVKLKSVSWLPFIKDERDEGLALTREACARGRFSGFLAAANLSWMLLEEGRWQEAASLCEDALIKHPESRLFLFPYAEALLAGREWTQAEGVYQQIRLTLAADEWPQAVNHFICLEKLSAIAEAKGDPGSSLAFAEEAMAIEMSRQEKERITDRIRRLDQRIKRIQD